jgi:hypothetical protein
LRKKGDQRRDDEGMQSSSVQPATRLENLFDDDDEEAVEPTAQTEDLGEARQEKVRPKQNKFNVCPQRSL